MNIREYEEECLKKLKMLGINIAGREKEITDNILRMPEDMLNDMEKYSILGLILDTVGFANYNDETNEYKMLSEQVYSFDVEVFFVDIMYTIFLNYINRLSGGELQISDITENTDNVNFEEGTGTQIVSFTLRGKSYYYEAEANNDWFDTKIINYVNQILKEQNSDKYLLATSDGFQNCILFYNTEEWAKKYNEFFPESKVVKYD